jgi:hypothetical protein
MPQLTTRLGNYHGQISYMLLLPSGSPLKNHTARHGCLPLTIVGDPLFSTNRTLLRTSLLILQGGMDDAWHVHMGGRMKRS